MDKQFENEELLIIYEDEIGYYLNKNTHNFLCFDFRYYTNEEILKFEIEKLKENNFEKETYEELYNHYWEIEYLQEIEDLEEILEELLK